MNTRIVAFCCLALWSLCYRAIAQDLPDEFSIGVYGAGLLDRHVSRFSQLPGIPNCCPEFSGSSDAGFDVGLIGEYRLSNTLSVVVRTGYAVKRSRMLERQFIGFGQSGAIPVPVYSEHHLSADLGMLHVMPSVAYAPILNIPLKVELGMDAGIFIRKQFSQSEQLDASSSANGILFSNGSASRAVRGGVIQEISPLNIAVRAGVRYDYPIGPSLMFSPELCYSFPLSNVIRDTEWKIHSMGGAVSIRYLLGGSETHTREVSDTMIDAAPMNTPPPVTLRRDYPAPTEPRSGSSARKSVQASPGKCWCILYSSYDSQQNAQRAVTTLRTMGISDARSVAWDETASRTTYYRVISGCHNTAEEATQARMQSSGAMKALNLDTTPEIIEWDK